MRLAEPLRLVYYMFQFNLMISTAMPCQGSLCATCPAESLSLQTFSWNSLMSSVAHPRIRERKAALTLAIQKMKSEDAVLPEGQLIFRKGGAHPKGDSKGICRMLVFDESLYHIPYFTTLILYFQRSLKVHSTRFLMWSECMISGQLPKHHFDWPKQKLKLKVFPNPSFPYHCKHKYCR